MVWVASVGLGTREEERDEEAAADIVEAGIEIYKIERGGDS